MENEIKVVFILVFYFCLFQTIWLGQTNNSKIILCSRISIFSSKLIKIFIIGQITAQNKMR